MIVAVTIGLASVLGMSGADTVNARSVAAAAPDCSDGYPRLGCKIWKVTIELEAGLPPKGTITCETTDEWQCMRPLKDAFN